MKKYNGRDYLRLRIIQGVTKAGVHRSRRDMLRERELHNDLEDWWSEWAKSSNECPPEEPEQ